MSVAFTRFWSAADVEDLADWLSRLDCFMTPEVIPGVMSRINPVVYPTVWMCETEEVVDAYCRLEGPREAVYPLGTLQVFHTGVDLLSRFVCAKGVAVVATAASVEGCNSSRVNGEPCRVQPKSGFVVLETARRSREHEVAS